jgi:hypothetical protein
MAQACSSTAAIAVALLIPGARPPVALAGAASTATVHLHLRMNELRKPSRVSGGTITSCRFDPFAARSSSGRYLR